MLCILVQKASSSGFCDSLLQPSCSKLRSPVNMNELVHFMHSRCLIRRHAGPHQYEGSHRCFCDRLKEHVQLLSMDVITYCRCDIGLYVFERNEAKADSLCSILLKMTRFSLRPIFLQIVIQRMKLVKCQPPHQSGAHNLIMRRAKRCVQGSSVS